MSCLVHFKIYTVSMILGSFLIAITCNSSAWVVHVENNKSTPIGDYNRLTPKPSNRADHDKCMNFIKQVLHIVRLPSIREWELQKTHLCKGE